MILILLKVILIIQIWSLGHPNVSKIFGHIIKHSWPINLATLISFITRDVLNSNPRTIDCLLVPSSVSPFSTSLGLAPSFLWSVFVHFSKYLRLTMMSIWNLIFQSWNGWFSFPLLTGCSVWWNSYHYSRTGVGHLQQCRTLCLQENMILVLDL